jgi:adenosylcobinamide-GDP ribazoletransferase
MNHLLPLRVALQFLTRLPLRLSAPPAADVQAHSLLWYPLVGALLGALLWLAALALARTPALLAAALLLTAWVGITGALHLDGLADSADAWAGGRGEPERSLAIMKDPTVGAFAVVAVVLVLVLKLAALSVLYQTPVAIFAAAVLARAAVMALVVLTPYARPAGLGLALAAAPRAATLAAVATVAVLIVALCGTTGAAAIGVVVLVAIYARRVALTKFGGFTGDTAGALIELTETAVVLTWSLMAVH